MAPFLISNATPTQKNLPTQSNKNQPTPQQGSSGRTPAQNKVPKLTPTQKNPAGPSNKNQPAPQQGGSGQTSTQNTLPKLTPKPATQPAPRCVTSFFLDRVSLLMCTVHYSPQTNMKFVAYVLVRLVTALVLTPLLFEDIKLQRRRLVT